MNDNHRLNPDELDAYLTARQQGEHLNLSAASTPQEIRLAERIQTLAEAAQPAPEFAAALEERLRQAAQSSAAAQPYLLGQRARLSAPIKRNPVMERRIFFTLASAAALILIAIMVIPQFKPTPPTAKIPVSALAPLPNLGSRGSYESKGGGGNLKLASGLGAEILNTGTFSGTEFILKTELPAVPDRIAVYRRPPTAPLTVESFRQIAARFGLQGPVYTQKIILYEPLAAQPPSDSTSQTIEQPPDVPMFYVVFDGSRQLSGDSYWYGVTYTDFSVQPLSQPGEAAPYEQLAAAAEAFLKERGLLDFPYQAEPDPYLPAAVRFARVIDGRPLVDSEIEVQFGMNDQIQSIYYHALPAELLGEYPIRTAQQVWEALLNDTLPANQISVWTDWPDTDLHGFQSWQPQYRPNEMAELQGYITVYEPAPGEQAPARLMINQLMLSASDIDLQTLASLADRQLSILGQVRQTESGGLVLDVAGWNETEGIGQTLEGVLQRQGDATLFVRQDGLSFWLPHAPANLPDGLAVELYGWETGRAEGEYPVLEWAYLQSPPSSQMDSPVLNNDLGSGEAPSQEIADTLPTEPFPAPDDWNPPDWGPGKPVEALEGQLQALIFENPDGARTYNLSLWQSPLEGNGWSVPLTGTLQADLSLLDRQWVRVWGRYQDVEYPIIEVERFEASRPEYQPQAWLGHLTAETLEGRTVAVLVTPDGQRLVIASTVRWPDTSQAYRYEPDRQVVFEGVLRPETFGGYPIIEEITWTSGENIDLLTDVSQYTPTPRPEVIKITPPPPLLPGKAYIEQIDLVYYTVYSYIEETSTEIQYVQPVWRFKGRLEDGTTFTILLQAAAQEYIQ